MKEPREESVEEPGESPERGIDQLAGAELEGIRGGQMARQVGPRRRSPGDAPPVTIDVQPI